MNTSTAPKWGTSKLGGGSTPAMNHAIPVGSLAAAVVGVLGGLFSDPPAWSWVGFAAYSLCTAIPLILLTWVVIKGEATMPDEVGLPEQSIEAAWSRQAGKDSFVVLSTLAAVALVVCGFSGPSQVVTRTVAICAGVTMLVGWLSFFVSYAWQKRNG